MVVRRALAVVALAAAGCGGGGSDVTERAETRATSTSVVTTTSTAPAEPPAREPEPEGPVVIELRTERRTTEGTEGFDEVVRDTLADPRGWGQAGFEIRFTDDAPNVVVVAEGSEVDAICAPYDTGGRFSCQIGPVVALNADRWREATDTWPGTLEEYRQMLVNHEVGHLLGRHHARPACEQPGGPAAVMYQQSAGVEGCLPNPWPLPWEVACAARHDEPIAPPYEPDATATCGPAATGPAIHREERFGAMGRGPVRIASMRVALELIDEVL